MNVPSGSLKKGPDSLPFSRRQSLRNLTLREQVLIAVMVITALGLGVFLLYQRSERQQQRLTLMLSEQREQLNLARSLHGEWKDLKQKPTAPVMRQALTTFIEKVARSFAIQDNLQLNALTSVDKGMEGVQVRFDRLKLDQLTDMLFQLENHRPVLRLSQLNISISPGNRLVRASFQVHKQAGFK